MLGTPLERNSGHSSALVGIRSAPGGHQVGIRWTFGGHPVGFQEGFQRVGKDAAARRPSRPGWPGEPKEPPAGRFGRTGDGVASSPIHHLINLYTENSLLLPESQGKNDLPGAAVSAWPRSGQQQGGSLLDPHRLSRWPWGFLAWPETPTVQRALAVLADKRKPGTITAQIVP